ncbi:hypothetical protein WJX81_005488 [Elliptochloris bilobata]|uniref:ABC transporter domain-containing protein n=1 Tax=Elliptochloris bilobata TaxID=381761 RepID=A0AAW1QXB4_9CHLO
MHFLLERVGRDKQLAVEFNSISAFVLNLFGPDAEQGLWQRLRGRSADGTAIGKADAAAHAPKLKQILFSVMGACQPGEVLALMGPSGSGKTTLLSVLGGRKPRAVKLEGAPTFNGKPLSKRAKRQVGFVLQDDLLYESLTVYETLYFAAMLRLPSGMTRAQKAARVADVIQSLGLGRCKDTIIGGFERRGVSGGERKRVSVGHELLINPSVILLDEPTSGLDSTTAMNLVASLCQLAEGGRSVITTIHQPSSRLYQRLDKLLLLSEGHTMYYGAATMAADWFHALGFTMPYGVNVADFILDLASGAVTSAKLDEASARAHLICCAELYAQVRPADDGYREGSRLDADIFGSLWTAAHSRKNLAASPCAPQNGAKVPVDPEAAASDAVRRARAQRLTASVSVTGYVSGPPARWGASYAQQFAILFTRSIKVRRFEALSYQEVLQLGIVAILGGLLWWQQGLSDTVFSANSTNGLIFFNLLFMAFRAIFVALFTFPNEQKMMIKERASGMYRLSAFYFARTASDLPMELSLPAGYILITYFMGGLRRDAGAFFANLLGTMLVTLVAQSLGLLIGATVMDAKLAQTVAAVLALTMMLVGGFYLANIPAWIAWLKYLSFVYFGYNLLLKAEYHGRTLFDCSGQNPPHAWAQPSCSAVPPGGLQEKLHLQVNTEEWPWEALALLGFLALFRICIYFALRRNTVLR